MEHVVANAAIAILIELSNHTSRNGSSAPSGNSNAMLPTSCNHGQTSPG
jgi:hypothetical protein